MEMRNLLTVAFFVRAIYAFGGGLVQNFVNYPSWKLIGAEDLPAVHKYVVRRQYIYVPFVLLGFLVNIVLIWFHHPAMSTPLIMIAAAFYLFILAVTLTLVIPIHMKLDQAKSDELIDKVVMYDVYLRAVPGGLQVIAVVALLYQVVSASSSS